MSRVREALIALGATSKRTAVDLPILKKKMLENAVHEGLIPPEWNEDFHAVLMSQIRLDEKITQNNKSHFYCRK